MPSRISKIIFIELLFLLRSKYIRRGGSNQLVSKSNSLGGLAFIYVKWLIMNIYVEEKITKVTNNVAQWDAVSQKPQKTSYNK